MYRRSGLISLAFSLLLLFTLSAQGADPARVQPAATSYIVTGSVTAPGGVIAAHDQAQGFALARLLDFFVAPAQAGVAGLLSVPNGTRVELVRLGDRGYTSAPIAVTTTQYGRYRFNLTALRLTVSSRLIVRVGNVGTGEQMRAFVSGKTVDINPVSEAAVQMVLHSIAAGQNGTLLNFTVRELQDLTGSLDLLTSVNRLQAAVNLQSSVAEIRNTAAADAGIMRFLAAAAYSGQTNIGPGDIGNFFPFARGPSWTYTVQETEDGIARPAFTTTTTIGGTRLINGVATTVFRNSNTDGDGRVGYDFNKKTTAGVFDWEPVKDGQMNRPHQFVRFPAAPGSSFSQTLGGMFDTDIDRDGIVERFGLRVTTTVVGLGTVYVPAGALPDTLKIRSVITGGATVSSTGKRIALTVTATEWYTRNLGLSKQTLNSRASYDGTIWRDTRTMQLTEASGFPFTGEFPLDRWATLHIESNDMVYDPVNRKLFVSVPSTALDYANHIVVIDPHTAQVEETIPMNSSPGPLAVSDDGQFLYIGLNGDQGSVLQISIPTLSIGPEWAISNPPGLSLQRYPYDISVQPGNPEVVVVSTNRYPFDRNGQDQYLYTGVIVLDAGIERAVSLSMSSTISPSTIEFCGDPYVAYGYSRSWSNSNLIVMSVAEDGIVISETKPNFDGSSSLSFKCAAGRIFTNRGSVFDAQTGERLHWYTTSYLWGPKVEPNSTLGRVAFVTAVDKTGIGRLLDLEVFRMDNDSSLKELGIPLPDRHYPTDLEDFGDGGYAIRLHDAATRFPARSELMLVKLVFN